MSNHVSDQRLGGSDKVFNGHWSGFILLATSDGYGGKEAESGGLIMQVMRCQIEFYKQDEHDTFIEVMGQFNGILNRTNACQIGVAGYDQKKFDDAMLWFQADGVRM